MTDNHLSVKRTLSSELHRSAVSRALLCCCCAYWVAFYFFSVNDTYEQENVEVKGQSFHSSDVYCAKWCISKSRAFQSVICGWFVFVNRQLQAQRTTIAGGNHAPAKGIGKSHAFSFGKRCRMQRLSSTDGVIFVVFAGGERQTETIGRRGSHRVLILAWMGAALIIYLLIYLFALRSWMRHI